jgi:hypothetical protein
MAELGGLIFEPDAVEPLGRAASGDYQMLAARIKDGTASQAERDLASDMILKAPKPAAHRPSSYDIFTRNLAIFDLVEDRMAAGDLMDVAVKAAEEQFKLSASTIYEIYDKFFAARDGREAAGIGPCRQQQRAKQDRQGANVDRD